MLISVLGCKGRPAVRTAIVERAKTLLGRHHIGATTARIAFVDDNGPKGGVAQRCTVTIHAPRRTAVRVEHSAPTAALAFDGALDALTERLRALADERREAARRPKKYFVSKRLL